MKNHILIAGAVVAALAIPFAADAQSGATTGAAGSVKGFVQDIKGLAVKNNEFRRVLYTAKNLQLVVMALKPKEEIGAEVHKLDQFLRVEVGTGEAVLDGVRTPISEFQTSSTRQRLLWTTPARQPPNCLCG